MTSLVWSHPWRQRQLIKARVACVGWRFYSPDAEIVIVHQSGGEAGEGGGVTCATLHWHQPCPLPCCAAGGGRRLFPPQGHQRPDRNARGRGPCAKPASRSKPTPHLGVPTPQKTTALNSRFCYWVACSFFLPQTAWPQVLRLVRGQWKHTHTCSCLSQWWARRGTACFTATTNTPLGCGCREARNPNQSTPRKQPHAL